MRNPLRSSWTGARTRLTPTVVAQADAPRAPEAANTPPEAESLCIVTAEDATLSFAVVAKDADGDPLTVTASQPESGRTEVGPDGTLTFVADEPGLQSLPVCRPGRPRRQRHRRCHGVRQSARGRPVPPAMARVAPADLPAIAQACATGIALETTRAQRHPDPDLGPDARPALPDPGRAGPADPAAEPRLRRRDLAGGRRRSADRHARRQHGLCRRLRGERPGRRSASPCRCTRGRRCPATSCSPACSRSP